MTFKDLLNRWNLGRIRGAQTRFARKIGVAPGIVSRWVNGKLIPGEDLRPKIAKEFGITVDELMACFRKSQRDLGAEIEELKNQVRALAGSMNVLLSEYKGRPLRMLGEKGRNKQ